MLIAEYFLFSLPEQCPLFSIVLQLFEKALLICKKYCRSDPIVFFLVVHIWFYRAVESMDLLNIFSKSSSESRQQITSYLSQDQV